MRQSNLCWLLLATLPTFAWANSTPIPEMERIVVSGTKTPKLLSNSPVAIEVIEGDTLSQITQGTVAQALEFIPSVVVTRSVKDGYNVQMQGFDSKHVLVLVNGQPLIAPAGSSVDLDQISSLQIDRIEVIKGAASVLYGSAAMGGVINIITKTENQDALSLNYGVGSYLNNAIEEAPHTGSVTPVSQLVNLVASQSWQKIQSQLAVLHSQDTGFDYDVATISQDAAALDKTFVSLTASSESDVVVSTLKYQFFNEAKEKVTSRIPGQSHYISYLSDVDQHQVDAQLKAIDQSWQLNGRYISHDETSGQSNSLRETQIQLAELDALKIWQFGNTRPTSANARGAELVWGASVHGDSLQQEKPVTASVEIDDESRQSIESYAQLNWITRSYQVLLGVRGQDDSDFGFHSATRLSGMLNFGTAAQPVKLRIGYGQGYRVPDLKERHYIFDHSNLGYMVLGDKSLVPEQAESVNVSLSYRTTLINDAANFDIEINSHASHTRELITTVNDALQSQATGLDISRYANVESADIYGFDITSELAFDAFAIQFNYSYLDSEDETGKRLENRPRHQFKANLRYDFDLLDLRTILYFVHQADEAVPSEFHTPVVDGFSTVNLRLNQRLSPRLNWHLSLNNLFDEHQDPAANSQRRFDPRPVSSREVRFGLQYHF